MLETIGMHDLSFFIMRGAPGTGKSTAAKKIQDHFGAENVTICSADDFFIRDGVYTFDSSELGRAHLTCQAKAFRAVENKVSVIIIDCTNIQRWEYKPYLEMIKKDGDHYDVYFVECRGDFENGHGVPAEKVAEMKARFQPDDRFEIISAAALDNKPLEVSGDYDYDDRFLGEEIMELQHPVDCDCCCCVKS